MVKAAGKDFDPERGIFLRRRISSKVLLQHKISKVGIHPNRANRDSRRVAFLARKVKTSFRPLVSA